MSSPIIHVFCLEYQLNDLHDPSDLSVTDVFESLLAENLHVMRMGEKGHL